MCCLTAWDGECTIWEENSAVISQIRTGGVIVKWGMDIIAERTCFSARTGLENVDLECGRYDLTHRVVNDHDGKVFVDIQGDAQNLFHWNPTNLGGKCLSSLGVNASAFLSA